MENGDRETLGHVAVAHDGEEHGAAADVARALIEDSSVAPTPTATSPLAGSTDSGRSGEPNDGSSGSDSDEDATRTAHKKSADGIGAKLKLSSKSRRKRKHNKLEYAPLQEQDAALIDNDLLLPASPMDTRQRDEHEDDHDTSSTSSSSATTTTTTTTTSSLSASSSSSSSSSSSRESVQVAEHPLERSGEWKHSTLPVFVKRTGPPLPPPPAPMMMAFSDETPSHLDEYNGDAYDSPIKPPARPDAAVAIDLSVEEQELAEANNLAARQAALQRTRLEHAPLAGDHHLSYLLLPLPLTLRPPTCAWIVTEQRRDLIRGVVLCGMSLFLWASAWSIHTINVQVLVTKVRLGPSTSVSARTLLICPSCRLVLVMMMMVILMMDFWCCCHCS